MGALISSSEEHKRVAETLPCAFTASRTESHKVIYTVEKELQPSAG